MAGAVKPVMGHEREAQPVAGRWSLVVRELLATSNQRLGTVFTGLRRRKAETPAPRLVVEVNEGRIKTLLVGAHQGRWAPQGIQMVRLDTETVVLPPEWLSAVPAKPAEIQTWIVIPRQHVSAQMVELPSTKPSEIADMLQLQIGKLTPYAPTEVLHNHLILEGAKEGYSRVLLFVVKREVVAQAVNVVTAAGLPVAHVMVCSEAIARWVAAQPEVPEAAAPGQRVAVLDLDTTLSELLIVSEGCCEFTRAIPIGLVRLTEEPEKWLEKLVEEIQVSLNLYQGEPGGKGYQPSRLLLMGPKSLVDLLVERLGGGELPLSALNPVGSVSVLAEKVPKSLTSLTALLGAGASSEAPRIDFVPPEVVLQRTLQERGHEIARMGVLLVTALTVTSLIVIEKIVVGNQILSEVNQKVAELAPEAAAVEKAKIRIRMARQRTSGEATTLRLLDRVYRAVPDEITLTAVRLETEKELSIKGYSGNVSRIFEFVTALERLPLLEAVKTKSVTKRKFGNQELSDFDLSCVPASAGKPP